jgi:spermidine synthase
VQRDPDQRVAPRLLLWGVFFLSGAATLVYELLWVQLLGLIFGVTYLAIATVTAVFMGGMAAGSLLGGRLVDRGRDPLRVFFVAEVLVALWGVLVPLLMPAVQASFVGLIHLTTPAVGVRIVIQLLLCCALLAVPAVAMGTTLPALTRAVVQRREQLGFGLGWLYGWNTLGATVGCGLTGFWAIWTIGVPASAGLAVAMNLTVLAVVATLLWRQRLVRAAPPPPPKSPSPNRGAPHTGPPPGCSCSSSRVPAPWASRCC